MALSVPRFSQGMIVFVGFTTQRGEQKRRPAVIYTPDDFIPNQTTLGVACITTSCYESDPDCVPLPWHPTGNVSTRLRRQSWVAVDETNEIDKLLVTPTAGYVPDQVMIEVLAQLKARGTP